MAKNNSIQNCQDAWYFMKLFNNKQKLGEIVRTVNEIVTGFPGDKTIESDASLILHNIWLGNYLVAQDANFFNVKNIRCVINVTDNLPNKFQSVSYVKIPIHDDHACNENLIGVLEYGADVIHKALSSNQAVLVHCKRGHNRSASVVAMYLMKYHSMSLADSIYLIRCIRPTAFTKMTCLLKTLIWYEYLRRL